MTIMNSNYPSSPGWKAVNTETSRQAAAKVKGRAALLRERVRAELEREPGTADEVAERLGESILSVRPRVSELVAQGRAHELVECGKLVRRRNASGHSAVVWRACARCEQQELI